MPFTAPTFVGVGNAGNSTEESAWGQVIALMNSANAGALHGFKNRLINGCFRFNQRAPASNADDTYCLDRWYVLTQTGAVAVTRLPDPEGTATHYIRLTQSQASAQRMGVAQIIESQSCRDLRAAITTLCGRVRLSASDDVRYAVLEHTGTADAVTSDVVNSWTNTSYTAGQFFIAGVNVLAVGEVACVANTARDLTALNATLGASAQNIIIFVWTENAVAQNVTLDLWNVQWEPGATATKFERRPVGLELALCQRYYEKSYHINTTPGSVTNAGAIAFRSPSTTPLVWDRFRATKRNAVPTMTLYSSVTGASGQWRDGGAGADFAATASAIGDSGFAGSGTVSASNVIVEGHWTADAEL